MLTTQLIIMALSAAPLSLLVSQEVTKPVASPPSGRLPAPAAITAVQLIDGHIRVSWVAVEGAVSYRLFRSVPPAGTTAMSLPNPANPGYDDADVKAGSTYYYNVFAVDAAGVAGLKVASTPVTVVPTPAATDPKQVFSWYGGLTTMGLNTTNGFIKEDISYLRGVNNVRWFSQDESMVSMQQQPNGDCVAVTHNKPGLVYVGVTAMPNDSTGLRTGVWRVIVQKTQ
jgi:hypothetical protein